ncbi:MAG: cytochrome P450 [Litoreibacter sp.]|nr:cytochrome P450 [Litoreibacter sp.]
MTRPPKPQARPGRIGLWGYLRLFRRDILSAQPERLYRAWMAEFRTPFFRSYLVNEPELVREVLQVRPMDFPKSDRVNEGLRPLLGNSVFVTNGEVWQRQRRIIDPAFEGGRLRESFGAMWAAGQSAVARLGQGGSVEMEEAAGFLAADVIFRTLFSLPIEDATAQRVFRQFQIYQRAQPIANIKAMLPLPSWVPRFLPRRALVAAAELRALIREVTEQRQADIAAGQAPDDLATKIMTTRDPETGELFDTEEMIDQVAIFFLAGHETSASALSWALYLLATHPDWQDRVADEAEALGEAPDFKKLGSLTLSRDVFREALRLYPPVPMMVREATQNETFRNREIAPGAQIVLSPWHAHRHERLWEDPDGFDPERWQNGNGKSCPRDAYMPFSAGARVCPGAGFAMIEGPLLLSMLVRIFRFEPVAGREPVPVAHLTVRARDGIHLRITKR